VADPRRSGRGSVVCKCRLRIGGELQYAVGETLVAGCELHGEVLVAKAMQDEEASQKNAPPPSNQVSVAVSADHRLVRSQASRDGRSNVCS